MKPVCYAIMRVQKKKRAVNPYSVKELMKGQKGYSIGD